MSLCFMRRQRGKLSLSQTMGFESLLSGSPRSAIQRQKLIHFTTAKDIPADSAARFDHMQ
uniref:Uncharacterized protein n=1 Tax=Yersinia enterocolitica W22703 TaxID=913028 RepID=F4N1X2_YEREN|nr:unknown protein [Yersinia enterocolitica W22703]